MNKDEIIKEIEKMSNITVWNRIEFLTHRIQELKKQMNATQDNSELYYNETYSFYKPGLTEQEYIADYARYKKIDDKRKEIDDNWKKYKQEYEDTSVELQLCLDELSQRFNIPIDSNNLFLLIKVFDLIKEGN